MDRRGKEQAQFWADCFQHTQVIKTMAPGGIRTPDHLVRSQIPYGGLFPFNRNDYCELLYISPPTDFGELALKGLKRQ